MDARRDAGFHLRDNLLAQSGRLSLLRTSGRLQASLQGIPTTFDTIWRTAGGTQNFLV